MPQFAPPAPDRGAAARTVGVMRGRRHRKSRRPAHARAAVPTTTGVMPCRGQPGGEAAIVRRRPALHRAMRRAAGHQQGESAWQAEAGDVAVAPGQVGRRDRGDAGLAQLAVLAVDVVDAVAVGVAVGVRTAGGDAGPFGSGGRAGTGGNSARSGWRSAGRRRGRISRPAACRRRRRTPGRSHQAGLLSISTRSNQGAAAIHAA